MRVVTCLSDLTISWVNLGSMTLPRWFSSDCYCCLTLDSSLIVSSDSIANWDETYSRRYQETFDSTIDWTELILSGRWHFFWFHPSESIIADWEPSCARHLHLLIPLCLDWDDSNLWWSWKELLIALELFWFHHSRIGTRRLGKWPNSSWQTSDFTIVELERHAVSTRNLSDFTIVELEPKSKF